MPRRVHADIPGHKPFDASLSRLISLCMKLATEAQAKAAKAKTEKQRAGFATMAKDLEKMTAKARALRHNLWTITE